MPSKHEEDDDDDDDIAKIDAFWQSRLQIFFSLSLFVAQKTAAIAFLVQDEIPRNCSENNRERDSCHHRKPEQVPINFTDQGVFIS